MKTFHQLVCGFLLFSALALLGETNPPSTFHLKGTVVDSEGRLVNGATVQPFSNSHRGSLAGAEAGQRVVTTNGSFEIDLPRQYALVLVRSPGFAPAWKQWWNPTPVVEERIVLPQASTLAGIVIDDANKPLPNVDVAVSIAIMEADLEGGGRSVSYLPGETAGELFHARTASDGRFRIEGFPTNAAADFSVAAPGKALPQISRDSMDFGLLQGHPGKEDIRLVLNAAGSVEGKIVAESGTEVPPAAKLNIDPEGSRYFGEARRAPAETQSDGSFRIADLASGNYQLRAVFGTNPVPDWVADTVPLTVEAGRTNAGVKVVATRGGLLEVAVIGEKDHQPQANVNINAYKNGYQGSGSTDTNGRALLRLPAGEYQVSAFREGSRSENTSTSIATGTTNKVQFDMRPASKVFGVVRGPDGKPAAGVAFQIVGGFGSYSANTPKTDAGGKFEIPFDMNQYRSSDRTPCLFARDVEHNLAVAKDLDDEPGPLDLRLEPGLTIAGGADWNGKPITNATAALVFWTGNSGMHLQGLAVGTNSPGRFEIPALPPGRRYGLYISAPGYGTKYANAVEADSGVKRVQIDPVELKPANLKLTGRVLDLEDKPVVGASVNLNGDGQPNGNTRTDLDGRFRFERVCEGTVRLYANGRGLQGSISAEGGATNVVLKLGQDSSYGSNSKTHKLTGVATDPEGKPVSGAQISVFPSTGNRTVTGMNGSFTLNWVSQQWQLQGGAQPSLVVWDLNRNLAVAESFSEDTTNLDVQLEPGMTVTGHVEDSEGAALSNARIGLWLYAGRSSTDLSEKATRTDGHGDFEIKGLPRQTKYTVYALAKDHGRRQQDIAAAAARDHIDLAPFVLKLADKILGGQVVNAEDKPVSGAQVSISGQDQANESVTTDRKGHFSVKVCEGSVRLYANGPDGYVSTTAEAGDTNVVLLLSRNSRSSRVPASFTRNLAAFGLDTNAVPAGKPLLLCLFDAEQPPSRRSASLLASRYDALKEKGIIVLGLQASPLSAKTWQALTNAHPLPFPLGRLMDKTSATKWVGQVDPLPWLVLRNSKGAVAAEGFSLDELDAKLTTLK